MSSTLYVGKRLSYDGNRCTVRYIGPVAKTRGEWLGVEWDDPTRGKHSGQADGVEYFQCASGQLTAGSFVRLNRPADVPRTFLEALRAKYASESLSHLPDGSLVVASSKPVRISGKEAEEVGFDKINKRLAILGELRIVLLDGMLISQRSEVGTGKGEETASQIAKTCPKIAELDLSRNLFEEIGEVALICGSLPRLRALRLDGIRFSRFDFTPGHVDFGNVFQKIHTLGLQDTLLSWEQTLELTQSFTRLESLTISDNQLSKLSQYSTRLSLPQTLTTLNLSSNDFTALSELSVVSNLPNLQSLIINHGKIQHLKHPGEEFRFHAKVSKVELAFNEIDSWSFIHDLQMVFPGLTSLRISHNPLYQSLQSPEGRPLSSEHGYMLTIARLGTIKTLNYSSISERERLDAETYYLGQITQELQLNPSVDEAAILAKHPRWAELCEAYGNPEIQRSDSKINPRSLEANLIKLQVSYEDQHGTPWPAPSGHNIAFELPKRFSVYSVIGTIARKVGLPGAKVQLFWKTGEWQYQQNRNEIVSEEWDSDESDEEEDDLRGRVLEEVQLKPSTRSIGNVVDGIDVHIRARCFV